MGRRVIHCFPIDFDTVKDGDIYASYCGKRFISGGPCTDEEDKLIREKTKSDPICKKCQAIKKAMKGGGDET